MTREVQRILGARMKGNVQGLLTWWRTPRMVSSSPGLSDKPSRAHLAALELTSSDDASWITTTFWAAGEALSMGMNLFGRLKRQRLTQGGSEYLSNLMWTSEDDALISPRKLGSKSKWERWRKCEIINRLWWWWWWWRWIWKAKCRFGYIRGGVLVYGL